MAEALVTGEPVEPVEPVDPGIDIDYRRHPLPSVREIAQGEAAYEFRPLEPDPDADGPGLRARVREALGQLDPRVITAQGPGLPLVLLFIAFMFTAWDESAFSVLLKEIQETFHFDLGYILVLASVVQVVTFMLVPFTGFLADRVRRVRMLAVAAFFNSASVLAAGAAPSVAALTGARVADGLGASLGQPAGYPLVTDWYPHTVRARVFAFLGMGSAFGLIIGPSVAGALGSLFGWRDALFALAVLPLAVGFGFLALKEPVRGAMDRAAMGADAAAAAQEQRPVGWAEGWRAARSIATLKRLWYAAPFLTAAGTILNTLLLLYFADTFNISPFERGAVGSLSGSFGLLGLAVSGPVADRLLARRPGRIFTVLGAILVLNCVLIVALLFCPVLWMAVLVAAPLGLGVAVVLPGLLTLVSMVVPARMRGFGIQTIAPWQILGLIGVIVLGELGKANDIRGTFVIVIVIFLIGAAVIGTAGQGVESDIRAARAASLADEEARAARARGASKMLICRDVDVTYDGTQVLFNVDLDLEEGEMVAVLGTNGAGKSTLLRAVCGLQEASNGAIFLDGEDVTHRPAHENAAAGVVFMPGGQAVFPNLTVAENLRAAAWLDRRRPAAEVAGQAAPTDVDALDGASGDGGAAAPADRTTADRMAQVMALFPRLSERMSDRAGDLSGGEQQMVALGQALLMRPRLLMIDELSLGLAPAVVDQLLDVLGRINAEGTTVVLVEQSVNVALTVARRAVFMDKGRIQFDGPTAELLGRSDLVRSVFLGGSTDGQGGASKLGLGPTLRRPQAASEETTTALAVDDLAVAFGGRRVLEGVSLDLTGSEVLGIIGPNGAGKTTLFDAVSGYVGLDRGQVFIAGQPADRMSPDARARAGLSRSFQNARLFPSLTVRENVAVALELHLRSRSALAAAVWLPMVRRSERRVGRRVDYLIDLLQLESYAGKFVGELSTGARRIVDLACVMAAEPKVLLLDEPSSGLAQAEVEVLAPAIRRLARDTACGVLVIEHDLPLVRSLSDRMLAMELGSVIAEGTPDEVISHPRVVESYLGASTAALERSGPVLSAALAAAGLVGATDSSTTVPVQGTRRNHRRERNGR